MPAAVDLAAVERVSLFLGVVEFGGGQVERDHDLLARFIAGLLDRFEDQIEGLAVAPEIGREAPFVADRRVELFALEHLLELVKDLDAGTAMRR